MNIYKIVNLDEERFVKFEEDERLNVISSTPAEIMEFELDRLDVMRKAYSYSILNRYVLNTKEMVDWFNATENGGKFIIMNKEDIKEEDKTINVNLILQGDNGFYKGRNLNVYNEIENINPFGVEELNNIVFKENLSLKKAIGTLIVLIVGAIGGLVFNKYIIPIISVLIILGFIADSKIKEKKRIKRFIAFNQARMDFWKKYKEEETGKKSVQVNYSIKGNRGYIETIEPK